MQALLSRSRVVAVMEEVCEGALLSTALSFSRRIIALCPSQPTAAAAAGVTSPTPLFRPFPFPSRAPVPQLQTVGGVMFGVVADELQNLINLSSFSNREWITNSKEVCPGVASPEQLYRLGPGQPTPWERVASQLSVTQQACEALTDAGAALASVARRLSETNWQAPASITVPPDWWHASMADVLVAYPLAPLVTLHLLETDACKAEAGPGGILSKFADALLLAGDTTPPGTAPTDPATGNVGISEHAREVWHAVAWAKKMLQHVQGNAGSSKLVWLQALQQRLRAKLRGAAWLDDAPAAAQPPAPDARPPPLPLGGPVLGPATATYLVERHKAARAWMSHVLMPMYRLAAARCAARCDGRGPAAACVQ